MPIKMSPKTLAMVQADSRLVVDDAASSFDANALQFPFRDDIRPGESGQGYALRMVRENHLNGLPQLKVWLGKGKATVIDGADVQLIHHWFGADKAALEFALGSTSTGRRDGSYVYAGQILGRSYFLNRSYPRICPACVEQDGICLIGWDFGVVVACQKHQRLLMDRCPLCQHPLSWTRPSVNTCRCEHTFGSSNSSEIASPLEQQFAMWVEARVQFGTALTLPDHGRTNQLEALMQLLGPLSLNGGLHITYALATAADYDEAMLRRTLEPKTPLHKAQDRLRSANALAEKIVQFKPVRLRILRPTVVLHLLAEAASAKAMVADRQLAQSILASLLSQKATSNWTGRNPQLSQRSLF
jgi:TniQ